ncbi:hypothetical protein COY34_02020 [candidate division WWE3 bacterium CG_4_10_14_0_2_um_filter_42_8]|uniref:RidA family protein n=1 Tax=candidate division WWE3 bacterium CG_4_10_14_0_2_um_filter_42_8 TaxID=1975074 RepID=A0A2M7TCA2_UNCKA|nr:MAG: hypothetical protein COY34_02020 [candidate division WWE3 bacterium CG_4_10_14_0_2_um_filter_42_8]
MQRQKVNSFDFAQKMGAYSHGYSIDSEDSVLIFTTGQIAMDKNGNVLYPDDPAKQAEFIFEALGRILKQAGASLDDVVKPQFLLPTWMILPKYHQYATNISKTPSPFQL